jgi:signal transduction histidine kinase
MKAFKTIGLIGLAITTVLNVVALLLFKRASAEYFSDQWWSAWFTSYIIWVSFTLIGFASHRRQDLGAGRPSGSGLMLMLLLAMLVPSGCLLWFMNQAVRNERLAVRQRLADAYRVNLSLVQNQLEAYWRQTAGALDAEADHLSPPGLFAKQVRAGLADAVICLDSASNVAYPGPASVPRPEALDASWAEAQDRESSNPLEAAAAFAHLAGQATNADLAARALLSQARCLVKSKQPEAAIAVLTGPLEEERYRHATDAQGRLLVPNAELMALELLKDSAPDRTRTTLERLKGRLLDYDNPALSSPQRRFLMHEVKRLFPDQTFSPMLAAEDLAARCLEAEPIRAGELDLRPTALPGVWQFPSTHGRVVALHQTEALLDRMRAGIASQFLPADVRLTFLSPGREIERAILSLPAGANMPSWRLALSLNDQRLFDTAADQRIASYVWIGVLVVAMVIVLAALALRLVRRQMALTQLRNDLVANVTHELKTPLASMRLLVDTLLNSQPLHEQTAREYLQLIAQENLRLSRLIDNFLTFSRMERNRYAFGFKEVPVTAIVEGAITAVRERFNAPGCRFETRIAPELPSVVADADALVTAVMNLLDNAYKYSGDEKQITLNASVENGSVFFAVKDNGIGLSPRDTKRIFKRFFQVDQRLSRSGGGCGLGLSIVKFIVTAHHGSVRVESQPGRGSTFTISLPKAETQPDAEGRVPANTDQTGGLT